MPDNKPTNPARYCINCAHSFQVLEGGEYYCRLVPMPNNAVTGQARHSFCETERADADKCGASGRNFQTKTENT
jgi:hypothetical protein